MLLSSPNIAELRQYSLRTSFEEGFGDWTAHSSDTVKPWTIYQAKDGYDKGYQPTRDHTLKTLNGEKNPGKISDSI